MREINAPILGVSAGSINMAERSLDTKDSLVPYEGLGLADITVKPNFSLNNKEVLTTLLHLSHTLPIYAMEDNSAIYVVNGKTTFTGNIHYVSEGQIKPLSISGQ